MDQNTTLIVIVIVAALVVAALVALLLQRRGSTKLRQRFGPEYGRVVEESGGKRAAENELHQREKRVERYRLHPLDEAARNRYAQGWKRIQAEFVDNPKDALVRADEFVQEVMSARGYPMADFDQRADDLSVEHPVVVENYRVAHGITVRHGQGQASTEDLRQAMLHYRRLFDELASRSVTETAKA
jgi:hypothetical protein